MWPQLHTLSSQAPYSLVSGAVYPCLWGRGGNTPSLFLDPYVIGMAAVTEFTLHFGEMGAFVFRPLCTNARMPHNREHERSRHL